MSKYYIIVNDKIYYVNDYNVARNAADYYAFIDSSEEYEYVEYGKCRVEDGIIYRESIEILRCNDGSEFK